MFKRFTTDESISGQSAMKSSQQRGVRQKLVEQMPQVGAFIDELLPKKEKGVAVRCAGHLTLIANEQGVPLFFQHRDGPFMPTLRTLHQYPFLLPALMVDSGAIKHVINGADVMVPGLRRHADTQPEVTPGQAVAIFADGKQHALAVGIANMQTKQFKTADKGVAVVSAHYVGDGLFRTPSLH